MRKKVILLISLLGLVIVVIFYFANNGKWVCDYEPDGGVWVKRGNPVGSQPNVPCVKGTDASLPQLSVQSVKKDPDRYANTNICIYGKYFIGFDTYHFGDNDFGDYDVYINTGQRSDPNSVCEENRTRCSGIITVCGKFLYDPAKPYFGQWTAQIDPSAK